MSTKPKPDQPDKHRKRKIDPSIIVAIISAVGAIICALLSLLKN